MSLEQKLGVVKEFDRGNHYGRVALDDDTFIDFHTTFFHSGRPARFARVGDRVRVVFNHEDKPVEVRVIPTENPAR